MPRKDTLHATLQNNNAASLTILKGFTAEQWQTPVPSESDAPWTAKDVLIHLSISEGGHVGQITRAVAGEEAVPADFDLTRYNRRSVQKNAEKSVEDLLKDLEANFGQLVAKLDTITEADLDKTGRHARGDTLTVEGFFLRCAEHRLDHAQQLQKAVNSGQ
jgi:hypothetical protein